MRSKAKKLYNWLYQFHPGKRKLDRLAMKARLSSLRKLDELSRQTLASGGVEFERVLVDGQWDNPNYWFRYALIRRALGLYNAVETGLLGKCSREKIKASFFHIGIKRITDFHSISKVQGRHKEQARCLLKEITEPKDLLNLKLPAGFPAGFLYDEILKQQRRAFVDLQDSKVMALTAQAISNLESAREMLSKGRFDLVVLSHALGISYGAVACAAISLKIPVIVLYGDFGVSRFIRLEKIDDLSAYPSRPSSEETNRMRPESKKNLQENGTEYLRLRIAGETDDVGSVFAYKTPKAQIDRDSIIETYGWDPAKPVIGVYNSNWFDYPHAHGLQEFTDFHDWIKQTLLIAKKNEKVNWLFKAHPCDDWYPPAKGESLKDMVETLNLPHVKIVRNGVNGGGLIKSLDGIITCHGTIGVEAAAMGKPVLIPYNGWYGEEGFVFVAKNRRDYLEALEGAWWDRVEIENVEAKAKVFAGWAFCIPSWQKGFVLKDDSLQDEIYNNLPTFIHRNRRQIEGECHEIKTWFEEGHTYLHTYKLARADRFEIPVGN